MGESDPRLHYAVIVVNMPPTAITCKCGLTFTGDDPVGQQKAHMDELN